MTTLVVMMILGLAGGQAVPQETKQEKPRVPKDSIELTVVGCLTGRALKTVQNRQAEVESGPYVGERTFRLAGKKDVMEEVKRQNGHLVEVVGIVKRADLDEKGVKVGRVQVQGASPVGNTRGMPSPAENVAVMDASSVRMRSSSCTPE
jgi:hypothetical protein